MANIHKSISSKTTSTIPFESSEADLEHSRERISGSSWTDHYDGSIRFGNRVVGSETDLEPIAEDG